MKFWLFFGGLALFIAGWFLFFKPFEVEKRSKQSTKIAFENFTFIEKGPKGTGLFMRGRRASSVDGRLYFYGIELLKEGDALKAQKGLYTGTKLYLEKDVWLQTSEYTLWTSKALYYLKTGIIQIDAPFVLQSDTIETKGQRAVVNLKEKEIKAYKIEARVEIR